LETWRARVHPPHHSRRALARAPAGRYSAHEVSRSSRGAPLAPHLRRVGSDFEVAPAVRAMVDFREHNLLSSCAGLPRMDLVLLRNVLIYFGPATRKAILARVRALLRPDGALLLGGGELPPEDSGFRTIHAGSAYYFRPLP
jgi:chemotaxis protein methyltransferase CheR